MYDPSYAPCAYTLYVLVPALTLPIACMVVHVLTLMVVMCEYVRGYVGTNCESSVLNHASECSLQLLTSHMI